MKTKRIRAKANVTINAAVDGAQSEAARRAECEEGIELPIVLVGGLIVKFGFLSNLAEPVLIGFANHGMDVCSWLRREPTSPAQAVGRVSRPRHHPTA